MKRAIVIGASSGIGFEVARLLLKDGWKVGVAARRMDLLQNIGYVDAAERIDVNDPQASEQLRGLISDLGGMDLFFYASGIGKQNRTLEEDIEIQTATTNGVGFTRMIGEAYRYFAEKGEGQSHAEHLSPGFGATGYHTRTEHLLHRHPSGFCRYGTA